MDVFLSEIERFMKMNKLEKNLFEITKNWSEKSLILSYRGDS